MPSLPRAARRRRPAADLDRPINARLYRISLGAALLLALAVSFTVTRPKPLPAPPLPAFDGSSATALATRLATQYPDREPGTPAAQRAADWVQRTLEGYGYTVRRDRFEATIPGRGRVPMENLIAIAHGRTGRAIIVSANRDDTGDGPGADVNASGTGALLELARLYGNAPDTAGGGALKPTHTLIFLSTDGGAFGSLGADHAEQQHAESGGAPEPQCGNSQQQREERQHRENSELQNEFVVGAEMADRPVLHGGGRAVDRRAAHRHHGTGLRPDRPRHSLGERERREARQHTAEGSQGYRGGPDPAFLLVLGHVGNPGPEAARIGRTPDLMNSFFRPIRARTGYG